MALLKRNTVKGAAGASVAGTVLPDELSDYPAVREFLSMDRWEEDGSKRETGTLLLFVDAAGLKVMLNDKDGRRVSFGVVDAGDGLFCTIEAMLLNPSTKWLPSKEPTARGKPK